MKLNRNLLFAMLCTLGSHTVSFAQYPSGWWGDIGKHHKIWVRNDSRAAVPTDGLEGHHIAVWQSHGRYYDVSQDKWKWQRVNLFETNEDLFTQTFVVPYLIPMLQNAGANVFTPRERDWQWHECVIDNTGEMAVDGKTAHGVSYIEDGKWKDYSNSGFQMPRNNIMYDGDLPFSSGSARYAKTKKRKSTAFAIYTPTLNEDGRYAVYVSYPSLHNSVEDAHYIVMHKGVATEFRVNQQMGGGTWVYLGTFDFATDSPTDNCVIVDNLSSQSGIIGTDAVRFGGGMGNISRGGSVSGLPRCFEGARYNAEWSGAPYRVYSTKQGKDDYSDDINVRSLMTNWLAGGSEYVPDRDGNNVPIELSLALHSDAGYHRDGKTIFGSLGICTTDFNDGRLASGASRLYSKDFAQFLQKQVTDDMTSIYGQWSERGVWDKNYSETRLPAVPSAILEMLSHQSLPDMRLGHDPNFKFNMARAIYKAALRFIANAHGKDFVVQPLAPNGVKAVVKHNGKVVLSWHATADPLESTAKPDKYIIYIAKGDNDFDNGTVVRSEAASLQLEPGLMYRFRITAFNKGGESFPSEEMAVAWQPSTKDQVMIVNGFHRLASPQQTSNGFDIDVDPGLSYGRTAAWTEHGSFLAGNDFNYASEHARAIISTGKYSVSCCSSDVIGEVKLNDYQVVDLLLGNERNDGYSTVKYKSLTTPVKAALSHYQGGLLVSGSYIGSDNSSPADSSFVADVLHADYSHSYCVTDKNASIVKGLQTDIPVIRQLNERHYASTSSDVLLPTNGAFTAMAYADGSSAAVALKDTKRNVFVMGFPFECISTRDKQKYCMQGILQFLKK